MSITRVPPPLAPASIDLVHRRPVWEALSDLFLDTDVSLSRAWRVRVLAACAYPMPAIERILMDEVHPVCRFNLLSVAGVWTGFDPAWLEERILRRLNSPWRVLHGLNLGRLTVPRWPAWRDTRAGVMAARAGVGAADPP